MHFLQKDRLIFVKKIIQKILSYQKTLAILCIVAIAIIIYIVKGVQKNVEKMKELDVSAPYFVTYPPVNIKGKNVELIKRGEYLVKAGDCVACHTNTPEKGIPFAGGLPMQTPFGTLYSPNITPDKETGIGNWTEAQFITAMREGISPKRQHYYPAFPYLYFNKVTTEDLIAIKAYLDSTPPVHQVNRKEEMVWPFNWRFLQSGWRLLFFNPVDTGPYKYDSTQSAEWNRGAYLVEGLGHCAMCHTPSYHLLSDAISLGAPMRQYNLTGAKIYGYLAPNITKSNLGGVSEEEILNVFTKDRLIGGGEVAGPMLEANHDSLRYLSKSDLLAIATYLKSVQSKLPPRRGGKGGVGKDIYENYCSGCHTAGGGGAPLYGDAMSWAPILKENIDQTYKRAIEGYNGMPAKGTCISCSNEEIKQAVDYMIAPVKSSAAKLATISKPKKLTLADGKRIYETNCSVCHTSGFKDAPKVGDKKAWQPIIDGGFVQAYTNIVTGRKGHLPRGACQHCSDAELIAALKYMMQESSADKNFSLW